MLKNDIEVNQKVEIRLEDNSVKYKSTVQDVQENSFSIGIPELKGNPLDLRKGDKVNIKLFTPKGHYIFDSTCLEKKEDPIPLYVLKLPAEAKRIQARNYVRVKVSLEVLYRKATEEEKELNLPLEPTAKGYSVDISGNGLLLAVREELSEGDLLYLKFTIKQKDKEKVIQTYGQVVRLVPPEESRLMNLVGVKFLDIDEYDRETLIQFLFERMRAQRHIK